MNNFNRLATIGQPTTGLAETFHKWLLARLFAEPGSLKLLDVLRGKLWPFYEQRHFTELAGEGKRT